MSLSSNVYPVRRPPFPLTEGRRQEVYLLTFRGEKFFFSS
nr:MAG TPA: hypothetical protein [Caudoviricetes sp.]